MRGLIATLLLVLTSAGMYGQTIAGKWKTIDDEDGTTKSIVTIMEVDGQYACTITELLNTDGTTCTACKGDKKDKPLVGLEIFWDMKKSKKNVYTGGTIMDPKSGKEYSCKLTLEGTKLKVRGYIGSPLLGRTQVWHRVN